VTLEPCSHFGKTGPCCDALIAAKIQRVVIAMQDPNPKVSGQGIARLRSHGIDVTLGVLEQEASTLNRGFFKRMQKELPWVTSKLAMSLDGRTAMASGESQWITSEASRQDVHWQRAMSSAVLTGVDTVIADNPLMTARVPISHRSPVRIVLDTHLRIPEDARILNTADGECWIFTADVTSQKSRLLEAKGVKLIQATTTESGKLDLSQVFQKLAKLEINQVWVEAGMTLNGALLESRLVDEWYFYVAPLVMGHQARGLFEMPWLEKLSNCYPLNWSDVRHCGSDLRLILKQG
jgi:diaminohydroxyphosphoribosylaminopyrimidine deaminase / 5-amino-6-(5-phosphoribosylamino)uracil reductase